MSTARKIAASLFLFALLISAGNAFASVRLDESNTNALSTGLVGYWPLDGNTTSWTKNQTSDLSGQGNTGTLISMSTSTSPVAGKIGQALKFNGSGTAIKVNSNIIGVGDVTACFWIKINQVTATHRIIDDSKFIIKDNSGVFSVSSDGTGTFVSSGAYTIQKWTSVCVTRTSTGTTNFYFNAVQSGTANQNSGTPSAGATAVVIGNRSIFDLSLSGLLDDVRIYNRALSPQEVQQLYAQGSANVAHSNTVTLTTGLVGYWTLDGSATAWTSATAGTTRDLSGNGGTGTLNSMSRTASPVAGKIGQGLKFVAGSSQDILVASSTLSITNMTTTAAWFKSSSTGAQTIYASNPTSQPGYILGVGIFGGTGALSWSDNNSGLSIGSCITSTTYIDGKWHHAVFTADGTNLNIYVDGVLVKSCAGTLNNPYGTKRIGSTQSRYFNGVIDDVRVYNRALSAQEVQQLYSLGTANVAHSNTVTLTTGLVGYWPLDGNTTSWTKNQTSDLSGQGNTGTLVSMSTTTSSVAGKIGQALKFNGGTNYVSLKNVLTTSGPLTVSAWINTSNLQSQSLGGRIIDNRSGGGNGWTFFVRTNAGQQFEFFHDCGTNSLSSAAAVTLPLNKWVHVVATWDGSTNFSGIHLYMNGTETAYANQVNCTGGLLSGSTLTSIGQIAGGSTAAFTGSIDDARVYNRALSAQEVAQLYAAGI